MDESKRKALEAKGWRFGDAGDFLELTEDERQLVEIRLAVSRAIRRRREENGLTQKQLAARIRTSQPRVAKIEGAAAEVSLDLMFRALFAAGGHLDDLVASASEIRKRSSRVSKKTVKTTG